jgi:RNA polymerase primary sigma factor
MKFNTNVDIDNKDYYITIKRNNKTNALLQQKLPRPSSSSDDIMFSNDIESYDTVNDWMVDDDNDVESAMIKEELEREIQIGLERLTSKQAKVLRMRFGIGDDCDYTLEEVGKQFDRSRVNIQQTESKALRLLRHPSRSDTLKTFLEEGVLL